MRFRQLFKIEVLHDYYKNGLCPDFILEPSSEASKALKNHRLLVRSGSHEVDVMAPLGPDEKMFLELSEGLEFTFDLKLINPSFINFTDLEWLGGEEGMPYFSNKNLDSAADNNLKHSISKSANSISPWLSKGVFGIVQVYVDRSLLESFSKQKTVSYKIVFNARKIKWKYYLVTEKNTGNNFAISDGDNSRSSSPIVFKNVTSGKQQQTNDHVADMLERQFPDKQKIVFESTDQIVYSQEARKNLQLKQDDTILVEHLPNPPADLEPYRIIKNIK